MFQTKVVEKIKTRILCSIIFFSPPENCAVCEIMWKNIAEPERPQMTIWRMRVAHWTPQAATNTHFRNMQYLLLFLCNNARTNAPQFYAISTMFLLTTKIY